MSSMIASPTEGIETSFSSLEALSLNLLWSSQHHKVILKKLDRIFFQASANIRVLFQGTIASFHVFVRLPGLIPVTLVSPTFH